MKNVPIIIGVILVALLAATVGYGYAYSSSTQVSGNGLNATAHSIDVLSVGEVVDDLIVPEPYHTGANIAPDQTISIEGYSLIVDWNGEPAFVRAWLFLDAGAWLYVESVSLTIDGDTYDFDNGGDTGCATDMIAGLDDGTYEFTVNFHYIGGNVPYLTYDDSSSIWNNGCRLTFAAGNDDPL